VSEITFLRRSGKELADPVPDFGLAGSNIRILFPSFAVRDNCFLSPLTNFTLHGIHNQNYSEHPVWIGEQLKYDLGSETPRIFFSPGLKFTTGLVLIYDDMPELSADLCIAEDGTWTIGAIRN
jgi:hypothetical protein